MKTNIRRSIILSQLSLLCITLFSCGGGVYVPPGPKEYLYITNSTNIEYTHSECSVFSTDDPTTEHGVNSSLTASTLLDIVKFLIPFTLLYIIPIQT